MGDAYEVCGPGWTAYLLVERGVVVDASEPLTSARGVAWSTWLRRHAREPWTVERVDGVPRAVEPDDTTSPL